jgi:hypothetical protein
MTIEKPGAHSKPYSMQPKVQHNEPCFLTTAVIADKDASFSA